ncbi:MAG: XRE family transcriptional regulator [Bdellovibrionales bacterium CG22_combo_CG10-13_8_21_14_all_38_13]|nr:MAG: XRE family transcriptional regulator [Bdellovibrionales bacterium CG22_combo_CG10-13_8_21_14_all_38_13]
MAIKIEKNIFAETGVKEPAVAMLKSQMIQTILDIFERREYKQKDAAEVLGVKQPVISDLANGKLSKFTLDRLLNFLLRLDWQIKVETSKKPKSKKQPIAYKQRLAC